MSNWEKRLYDAYVTSGQSASTESKPTGLNSGDYPYFNQLIKRHLARVPKNACLADLACGDGALMHCLRSAGFSNLEGVDISPEQVELAHRAGLDNIECQDIATFLTEKKGRYDVIFLMDILEHLSKRELLPFLDLVHLSLKRDALVIVHVPNGDGLFGMSVRYGDLTHSNCFTARSMSQVLRTCGFDRFIFLEDKPVIHGVTSMLRHLLWTVLTIPVRLLAMSETGVTRIILSSNMLVIAHKRTSR